MAESTRWILWAREDYRKKREQQDIYGTSAPSVGPPEPAVPTAEAAHRPDAGQRATATRARPVGRATGPDAELIDQIIDQRLVEVQYQAVYDIQRQIVGFEALSRGPNGPLRSPNRLFAAARAAGRLGELDWICRAAAFREMLQANLPASLSLFVNVEPDSLIEPCPEDLLNYVWQAESRLRVYIDITGQALARYPCQVLETVRRARAAKWGVAINDIEASTQGIALLPTLEPDIVKLNHNLLSTAIGNTGTAALAAMAESERTGAAVLVERVQDESAAALAAAIGATYQQGHLFGQEGQLPGRLPAPQAPMPLLHTEHDQDTRTPWDILTGAGARRISRVTPQGLAHLTKTMAGQVFTSDHPPLAASVTPTGSVRDPESVAAFRLMLERSPLVVILGPDVEDWNDWRVRAANLPATHPWSTQRCFLLLSPMLAMVIAARALPEGSASEVVVSQDPVTCRTVLRAILATADCLAGGVYH